MPSRFALNTSEKQFYVLCNDGKAHERRGNKDMPLRVVLSGKFY